jgi:hypothetical protein
MSKEDRDKDHRTYGSVMNIVSPGAVIGGSMIQAGNMDTLNISGGRVSMTGVDPDEVTIVSPAAARKADKPAAGVTVIDPDRVAYLREQATANKETGGPDVWIPTGLAKSIGAALASIARVDQGAGGRLAGELGDELTRRMRLY